MRTYDEIMERLEELHDSVDEVKMAVDERPPPSTIDLSPFGVPLLLLAVVLSFYGCERMSELESRRKAWEACAAARELTPTCQLILGRP